jgi:hypothetical protein
MANWFWLLFFSLVWLLPVAWHGLIPRPLPGLPPLLERASNLSCLFVRAQPYVPVQYIQVLLPGASDWVTEEDGHYLRMSPFGTRNRLDEMLRKSLNTPRAREELTDFVQRAYARRTGVQPVAVRLVTGIALPPFPPGRFRKPALPEIPHTLRSVWFNRVYAPVPSPVLFKRP